jgi:hypothetical protein
MPIIAAATAARGIVEKHLSDSWNRTVLATYSAAPDYPDPGHGEDKICPLIFQSEPWDPNNDAAAGMSPFTRVLLRDGDAGLGTGWVQGSATDAGIVLNTARAAMADVRWRLFYEFMIATPPHRGLDQGELYAAGIRALLWDRTLEPAGAAADSTLRYVLHDRSEQVQAARLPEFNEPWLYQFFGLTLVVCETNPGTGPGAKSTITT